MQRSPAALIEHKRDGGEHGPADIHALIAMFSSGEMEDYQMSAWLMAAYLRGLSDAETLALTEAMLHSGHVLSLDSVPSPKIDKHSTGGVGDKLSLPLAPLVACCDVHVPMIAGRGLGHTGGTLDKLESIAGYDTRLTIERFERVVRDVGASIIGQTAEIAPADRRLYALRDVTGTVSSRPLIVASILSKKLAAGLDGLILDVKAGRGAFMKDAAAANELATSLVRVARALGTPTVALVTRMEEPLGRMIGNALEVRESIDILRGEGPADATEMTLVLGEEMLLLAGVVTTRKAARQKLERALSSGTALERFARLIDAQGGDARVVEAPELLPRAPKRLPIPATKSGVITSIDSLVLADVALELGAGRKRQSDEVDPAVGIEIARSVGESVERGQPLAWLHARREPSELLARAERAFSVGLRAPKPVDWVLGRVVDGNDTPEKPDAQ